MANKKLSEMTEEELLQLVKKYYDEMDYIMTEEEDEEACEKVYKKYIKAYEQLLSNDFDKYVKISYSEIGDNYDAMGRIKKETSHGRCFHRKMPWQECLERASGTSMTMREDC